MEFLQVTFRNMKSSPTVEEWISEEAKKVGDLLQPDYGLPRSR